MRSDIGVNVLARVPRGGSVLLALSGGADSVAMTRVLHALANVSHETFAKLAAAHFNHKLRGAESEADREFCERLCGTLGIPLFYGEGDVAAEAKRLGTGTEEAGRNTRYAFLTETAVRHGFTHIATAHTADDNAETVLLNLTRGCGLTGLTGIPPERAAANLTIIRPMLSVTREEELEYLAELGQDYRTDSTNLDGVYRRNRVRSRVIPFLREENPALLAAVTRMAGLLRSDAEYLDAQAAAALKDITVAVNTVSCGRLAGLHPAVAGRAVRLMCANAREAESVTGLSEKHITSVLTLCDKKSPSGEVNLPSGLTARRVYGNIRIEKSGAPLSFAPVKLALGETVCIPELGLKAVWGEKIQKVNNLVCSFSLDSDTIVSGLTVRPRKAGDSVKLAGRNGTKTLQNLFTDAKIPRREREAVPVLCDGEGIAAVGGFGTAARCAPKGNRNETSVQIYMED